jgi:hypothetical protein
MAKLTASEFADKHIRRTKGALEDMRTGIKNVTEAPTLKAAAKADKMKARLVESIDSGKWQDGLKRVSLEEWKDKALNVGVNRVSQGLDANRNKIEAFASELLPYIETGQKSISNMPDLTLEDSVARAGEWIRHMSKFKRKR